MGTFGGIRQHAPSLRRPVMSRRQSSRVASRVVQPALSLGHADVTWEALPPSVQSDVLARWCELLCAVMPPAMDAVLVAGETRP